MNPAAPERQARRPLTMEEPMPGLSQQTILITGATDGLGKALATALARDGATVLLHGRDPGRLAAAVAGIRRLTGAGTLRTYSADFADLEQVRRLADSVLQAEPALDVLVNNAGIGATVPGGGRRAESRDGIELRFQVNYLAGYLLTSRLMPLLGACAPSRVVFVSSAGQAPIDFDDVMLTRSYSGVQAYCQSKLAQVMMALDIAEDYESTGVAATALHPASYMPTKIVASPASSLADGVAATMRLIEAADAGQVNGRYFNQMREARADEQAYDLKSRRRLHELSEQLTRRAGMASADPDIEDHDPVLDRLGQQADQDQQRADDAKAPGGQRVDP
jgi:NAD(P)-dependent dehydrogenase (short-subunit alcohol dehydrogenase family)